MRTHASIGPWWAIAMLLFTGACAQMSGMASKDEGGGPPLSQAAAAEAAMQALGQLVTPANSASVGFDSAADVRQARAGDPVDQRTLSYERLLAWQSGITVDELLDPQELALYPVEVGGSARTSFVLRRVTNGWRVAAVGDRTEVSTLRRAKDLRSSQAQVRVLAVPGLNLEFLQATQGDKASLIAVRDMPELNWKEGASRDLAEGLVALADYAKTFDKLHAQELREHKLVK
jgi:hypothetical protein